LKRGEGGAQVAVLERMDAQELRVQAPRVGERIARAAPLSRGSGEFVVVALERVPELVADRARLRAFDEPLPDIVALSPLDHEGGRAGADASGLVCEGAVKHAAMPCAVKSGVANAGTDEQ